jgi:hypothetical protein
MRQPLSVLVVEDSEHDAALLIRELRRGGYDPTCERVDCEAAMVAALNRHPWDIVVADYSMPRFNAKAALEVIAQSHTDVPCIVVSGSVGEETAVEVMRAGAQDLVLKHNLRRLPPAIAREVDAARARRARKNADAKLDHERQLLRQLMQGIPDAICFKDNERRYIHLNDAERHILNLPSDTDAIGKTIETCIAPELAQKRRVEEERLLATGEALVGCLEKVVGTDGSARWLSATKAPIRGPDGEIVGLVEIARDITESKRQEQLKNEFVATVSHELRTPLTSIMGSIGFLVGTGAGSLPKTTMRMLEIALDNCRRLVDIVNDILDIEKIESRQVPYDRRPVDALALVEDVIRANRESAQQHSVGVELDPASTRGVVVADPDRLTQVLTNLLSNALKFSPRGSAVILSVEAADDMVCIKVRDHGPGIPPDYKDRIFEKFVQVDATDRRQRGGTGLGLSIAKQIVSQLDGELSFESARGGGTIFKVELHAAEDRSTRIPARDLEHQSVSA